MGSGPSAPRALATVALALAAIAAGSCGEGDSEADAGAATRGVGELRGVSTAQLASCEDWRRGTREQRYVTLAEIRGQLTAQSASDPVSDLPDDAAYEMFEKVCSTGFSDSLRLYKLYAKAEAFAPLRTDLDRD